MFTSFIGSIGTDQVEGTPRAPALGQPKEAAFRRALFLLTSVMCVLGLFLLFFSGSLELTVPSQHEIAPSRPVGRKTPAIFSRKLEEVESLLNGDRNVSFASHSLLLRSPGRNRETISVF